MPAAPLGPHMSTRHDTEPVPTLPALEPGVTRIETDDRATGALPSLVLDHALLHEGPVWWVDSGGHARTDRLARLAPSERALERIRVARAFTPYQHSALVEQLTERATGNAALVVCPSVDGQYRHGDAPRGGPRRMVASAADRLERVAADTDTPVLLTCEADDALSAPVADATDRTVGVESTPHGPRFVGEETETLVYRDATGVQTTLAFWARVLTRRQAALAEQAPVDGGPADQPAPGADDRDALPGVFADGAD